MHRLHFDGWGGILFFCQPQMQFTKILVIISARYHLVKHIPMNGNFERMKQSYPFAIGT